MVAKNDNKVKVVVLSHLFFSGALVNITTASTVRHRGGIRKLWPRFTFNFF